MILTLRIQLWGSFTLGIQLCPKPAWAQGAPSGWVVRAVGNEGMPLQHPMWLVDKALALEESVGSWWGRSGLRSSVYLSSRCLKRQWPPGKGLLPTPNRRGAARPLEHGHWCHGPWAMTLSRAIQSRSSFGTIGRAKQSLCWGAAGSPWTSSSCPVPTSALGPLAFAHRGKMKEAAKILNL